MMTADSAFGGVPFTIIRASGAILNDWTPDIRLREFHIPGSNIVEVQATGMGLLTVSYMCRFGSDTDFASFMALAGQTGLLRVPYEATAYPGDRDGQLFDRLYKEFDDVLFAAPLSDIRRRREGVIDATVTYKRAMP